MWRGVHKYLKHARVIPKVLRYALYLQNGAHNWHGINVSVWCEVSQMKRIKKFYPNNIVQKCYTVAKKTKKHVQVTLLKEEQRMYIKIECLRGNTVPIITANLCEACSHDAMNHRTVTRWFKWFQKERRLIEDDARTGRPFNTTDNTSIVIAYTLLDKNRQMMTRKMQLALS